MKKSKTTKRALLVSALSMLLCLAMLIGSTFAWFTDSVTSGKNKIVAGNLDVELEYAKEFNADGTVKTWAKVDETTNLFLKDALWEPGHVEVVNLKIENVGTLALTYQFGVNIAHETPSVSVEKDEAGNNKPLKLSDHIKFALIGEEKTYAKTADGRAQAITDAEAAAPMKLSELAVDEHDVLYPTTNKPEDGASEKLVTMIVYMPTTVGNEANYLIGEAVPEIDLGVKLVATQTPFEVDSFDENYDENLPYPVIDGTNLTSSLKKGGNVMLGDDVVYDETTNPEIDTSGARTVITKTSVLDLNGNTIKFDSGAGSNNFAAIYLQAARANLTVNGEGTIDATATTGAYCFHLFGNKLSKPTLTINGGTYIGNPTAVNVERGTAYINGGFFSCKPAGNVTEDQYRYTLNCVDANYKDGSAEIIVTGGTFVNFNPADNQAEGDHTNFVAEGYKVVSEEQANGDTWYTVVPDVPTIDEVTGPDPL